MKRNNDQILKYLADMMNETEKAEFETLAQSSVEIRNTLTSVKDYIFSIQYPTEADDRYFVNLLPKIRERLEKQKNPSVLKKFYYFTSTVSAGIVALLFLFKPVTNFDQNYKQLASEVAQNISDQEVSQKYFADLETDPLSLLSHEEDEDINTLLPSEIDLGDISASNLLKESVVDEYSGIHNFSDNELEKIANSLNSLNVK